MLAIRSVLIVGRGKFSQNEKYWIERYEKCYKNLFHRQKCLHFRHSHTLKKEPFKIIRKWHFKCCSYTHSDTMLLRFYLNDIFFGFSRKVTCYLFRILFSLQENLFQRKICGFIGSEQFKIHLKFVSFDFLVGISIWINIRLKISPFFLIFSIFVCKTKFTTLFCCKLQTVSTLFSWKLNRKKIKENVFTMPLYTQHFFYVFLVQHAFLFENKKKEKNWDVTCECTHIKA